MSRGYSPSRVEVDLGAIRRNARGLLARAPGAVLLAVVKEDAYGHGAPAVARTLSGLAAGFGVATAAEGLVLRRAGIRAPVVLLSPAPPADARTVRSARLEVAVGEACDWRAAAPVSGGRAPVHLKLDTGMGRLGLRFNRIHEAVRWCRSRGVRRLAGSFTHLAQASDPAFTRLQLGRFRAALGSLRTAGIDPGLTHAANSEAVLEAPAARTFGAIRPGLALYGCAPGRARRPSWLTPAMAWRVPVLAVREVPAGAPVSYARTWRAPRRTRLAVLPVGYAGGLSRAHSNRGTVLLRGRAARIRGRVCMNLTLVDITGRPDVRPGTVATLLGRDGGAELSAETVASRQGTITYEVLCVAGGLSPRRYRGPR